MQISYLYKATSNIIDLWLLFTQGCEKSLKSTLLIWRILMRLSDIIEDQSVKASIVEDCTQLIDEQVSNKTGLSGMALKTAYKVVKGVGPGYIRGAIGRILPEAFIALDPLWHEGTQAGDPLDYLVKNRSQTAEIILGVTDARLHKASAVIATTYGKLRKSVKSDVEEAVPGLAVIIGTHIQTLQKIEA
jgi:hypothetical protein